MGLAVEASTFAVERLPCSTTASLTDLSADLTSMGLSCLTVQFAAGRDRYDFLLDTLLITTTSRTTTSTAITVQIHIPPPIPPSIHPYVWFIIKLLSLRCDPPTR